MPRITQNRKDYKLKDFCKWVKKKMIDEEITQTDLAFVLGMDQPTLSRRLSSGRFTLEEIILILNYFKKLGAEEIKDLFIY